MRRFPQVHLLIGLLGNAVFIAGTALFMAQRQDVGVYFFLAGSCGMFLASLGEVLRAAGRRSLAQHDVDPHDPRPPWSDRHGSDTPPR